MGLLIMTQMLAPKATEVRINDAYGRVQHQHKLTSSAAKPITSSTDSSTIEALVDQILAANPQQLADFRAGKDKLFGYFVGQAMKESGGKMNPQQLNDVLKKKLQGVG